MKVYISSTYSDLIDERSAVQKAILDLRLLSIGMENYSADGSAPVDKCLADVRECELYVLLVAYCYGFEPDGFEHSITNLEYLGAVKHEKQPLVFLLRDDAPWPRTKQDPDLAKIDAFRAELQTKHTVNFFSSTEELASQVKSAVSNRLKDLEPDRKTDKPQLTQPLVSTAHMPQPGKHFVGPSGAR